MAGCDYAKIEVLIRAKLRTSIPGVYQILQSLIMPGTSTMIVVTLVENPSKIVMILGRLYDEYTARLITKQAIIEPIITKYGKPLGYDIDRLVDVMFTDPLLFSRVMRELLCGS